MGAVRVRALIAFLVCLNATALAQDLPDLKGHTAEYWVNRIANGDGKAVDVVLSIGPSCLPLLLDRFSTADEDIDSFVPDVIREFGAKAVPQLLDQAKRGSSRRKIAALTILLESETVPPGVPELVPQLLSSSEPKVRRAAALLTSKHGIYHPDAVPALVAAATSADGPTRRAAVAALGHFPAQSTTVSPVLIGRLGDETTDVQRTAIDSLRRLGDRSDAVRTSLQKRLRDRALASDAAWALIGLGLSEDEAVQVLVAEMERCSGSDRADRINAIAGIGPAATAALPALRKQLESNYPAIKLEAAWAMFVIARDWTTARAVLRRSLREPDRFNLIGAAWIISRAGPTAEDLLPDLLPVLKNDDNWIRRNAAFAVGFLGPAGKSAIPQLRAILVEKPEPGNSRMNSACMAAAASLARLGETGPRISAYMKEVRRFHFGPDELGSAAIAYAWRHGLSTDQVVESIVRVLDERYWSYEVISAPRYIEVLADIGPEARAAIPALERLEANRFEIRTAAEAALRRIRE